MLQLILLLLLQAPYSIPNLGDYNREYPLHYKYFSRAIFTGMVSHRLPLAVTSKHRFSSIIFIKKLCSELQKTRSSVTTWKISYFFHWQELTDPSSLFTKYSFIQNDKVDQEEKVVCWTNNNRQKEEIRRALSFPLPVGFWVKIHS